MLWVELCRGTNAYLLCSFGCQNLDRDIRQEILRQTMALLEVFGTVVGDLGLSVSVFATRIFRGRSMAMLGADTRKASIAKLVQAASEAIIHVRVTIPLASRRLVLCIPWRQKAPALFAVGGHREEAATWGLDWRDKPITIQADLNTGYSAGSSQISHRGTTSKVMI